MSRDPFADPVREAFARYRQRFPIMDEASRHDAMTSAVLKQIERMLVAADCAMEDEGLSHEARRRVISTALYGGPDEEAAAARMADTRERLAQVREDMAKHVAFTVRPEDLLTNPADPRYP